MRFHGGEFFGSASQEGGTRVEDPAARLRRQLLEKPHAQPKAIRRTGLLFRETTELGEQFLSPEGRQGVLLPRLTALSGNRLSCYPLVIHESAEQRIDEIVMQDLLPKNDSGLMLELVPVLWPRQQHRQDY